jgi:predicted enzyme related to lactoylglutathione lyase
VSDAQLFMVTLVVPDMDDAIAHYTGDWGFSVFKDAHHPSGKRWVEIAAAGGARLRLAQAQTAAQIAAIGRQTGGLVSFFLKTSDFDADVSHWLSNGIALLEPERTEPYGRIVVLGDAYGNRWDVIEAQERPSL